MKRKAKTEIQNDWLLKLEEIKRSTWSWNSSTGLILCVISYNIPRKMSKKLLYCFSDNARNWLLFIKSYNFYPYLSPPLKFSFLLLLLLSCLFLLTFFFFGSTIVVVVFLYVLSKQQMVLKICQVVGIKKSFLRLKILLFFCRLE